jgi:hypothetical protein
MAGVIGGLLTGLLVGMAIVVLAVSAGGEGEPEAVSPTTEAPAVRPSGLPRVEDETRPALPPLRHDG